MDNETLAYPRDIAPIIGLGVHEVNAMKNSGCRFYGRKTSVKWVREFLDQVTLGGVAAPLTALREHPRRSSANRPDGQAAVNGSRASLPLVRKRQLGEAALQK